jgi:small-conductance mechanosensitive channel
MLIVLATAALLAGVPARAQESAPAPPAAMEPATLSLWNRTVTTFRAPVGGVAPRQRVENAEARLAALPAGAADASVVIHPGRVGASDGLMLAVGDRVVFGLVPGDLDPESNTTLEQAATAAARRLQELLAAQAAQRDARRTLRGAGYSLLALIVFVVAVRLILYAREAAVGKLSALFVNRRVSIAGIDLVPTLESVERATFRVLSWALILALAYLGLTFIFQQFPYTEPLGDELGGYVRGHLYAAGRAIVTSLPSLVGVAAVLLVTRAISLWVSRLLVEVEHGVRAVHWLAQEQAKATRRIASGVIWVLGIATAYPLLPWSDSRAFQGMSVVLGLAVSFASGGLINHWVSGLMVLYSRSFRVGDFVAVGAIEGVVTEMGALATKLRTMRREEVTIPNGVMASDKLVNHTRLAAEQGMLLSTSLSLGYDVPWQRVRELLLAAAAATPGVAVEPAPRVLTWELSDFFVTYQLHAYLARDADRIAVRAELNTRILDRFAAAGVQIMTPHFESQPERRVLPLEAISPTGQVA